MFRFLWDYFSSETSYFVFRRAQIPMKNADGDSQFRCPIPRSHPPCALYLFAINSSQERFRLNFHFMIPAPAWNFDDLLISFHLDRSCAFVFLCVLAIPSHSSHRTIHLEEFSNKFSERDFHNNHDYTYLLLLSADLQNPIFLVASPRGSDAPTQTHADTHLDVIHRRFARTHQFRFVFINWYSLSVLRQLRNESEFEGCIIFLFI